MATVIVLTAFLTGAFFALFPLAIPMALLILGPVLVTVCAWALYVLARHSSWERRSPRINSFLQDYR